MKKSSILSKSVLGRTNFQNNSGKKINQSVSYGEVQIILEDVQKIKEKAIKQIQHLTLRNAELEIQIEEMNKVKVYYVQEMEKKLISNQQIKEEVAFQIRRDYRMELRKQFDQEMNNTKQSYQKQYNKLKEKYDQAQINIDNIRKQKHLIQDVNADLRRNIKNLQLQFSQKKSKLQEIINIVTKRKPQILNQILFLMTNIEKNFMQLNEDLKNRKKEYEILMQNNQKYVQKENNIKEIIQQKNKEIKDFVTKIQQQNEKIKFYQKEETGLNFESEKLNKIIADLKQTIIQKQTNIQNQKNRMFKYQQVIKQQRKKEIKLVKKEIQTKQLFEEHLNAICSDEEDYTEIIEKLQYLQKFKSQHFYNIQKIQFLCKMLD